MRTALQRRLDLALYRRCGLLIAASTALGEELIATYTLPAERVCVVAPGSDLPLGSPRAQGMRNERRIALLCVANWVPNKGVIELLDAVADLPADDATLHLVGRDDLDPTYAKRVHTRLRAPDLGQRVVVHGQLTRDEIAGLYAGADVFVLTSYAETYGTVYGEALGAGLPTVGWRSGNLPNLVTDGREGCLLVPGDVRGLAAALHRLATDDQWRDRLRRSAAERGRTLPTWSTAADAFFAALRRLVEHD